MGGGVGLYSQAPCLGAASCKTRQAMGWEWGVHWHPLLPGWPAAYTGTFWGFGGKVGLVVLC